MSTFYENREDRYFIGEMTHWPVPVHVHDLVEILVLERGSAVLSIDGEARHLGPGDAALIFPLVPHAYLELSPDRAGLVAIFPAGLVAEYAGTFQTMLPERTVLPAEELGEETRYAVRCLREASQENSLPRCSAWLHVVLAGILHRTGYRSAADFNAQSLGRRILQYTTDHCCEEITLNSTARALGISPSHLSHFFSGVMRINFRRFINARRVERARLMMRDPELTLTMISGACGYANMRTFRRAFYQETGELPSEHAQAMRRQQHS